MDPTSQEPPSSEKVTYFLTHVIQQLESLRTTCTTATTEACVELIAQLRPINAPAKIVRRTNPKPINHTDNRYVRPCAFNDICKANPSHRTDSDSPLCSAHLQELRLAHTARVIAMAILHYLDNRTIFESIFRPQEQPLVQPQVTMSTFLPHIFQSIVEIKELILSASRHPLPDQYEHIEYKHNNCGNPKHFYALLDLFAIPYKREEDDSTSSLCWSLDGNFRSKWCFENSTNSCKHVPKTGPLETRLGIAAQAIPSYCSLFRCARCLRPSLSRLKFQFDIKPWIVINQSQTNPSLTCTLCSLAITPNPYITCAICRLSSHHPDNKPDSCPITHDHLNLSSKLQCGSRTDPFCPLCVTRIIVLSARDHIATAAPVPLPVCREIQLTLPVDEQSSPSVESTQRQSLPSIPFSASLISQDTSFVTEVSTQRQLLPSPTQLLNAGSQDMSITSEESTQRQLLFTPTTSASFGSPDMSFATDASTQRQLLRSPSPLASFGSQDMPNTQSQSTHAQSSPSQHSEVSVEGFQSHLLGPP